MASIGEQIIAARKAKGMTQDALAEALNITRAGISNYETGRRLPDAETLLKISAILEYSFEDEAAKRPQMPETALQEASATSEAKAIAIAQKDDTGRKRKRTIMICAAALAVILCVSIALVMHFNHKPTLVVKGAEGEVPPLSYFDEVVPNEAGKAYLGTEPVASVILNGETPYQMYDFNITERNGIGFNIEYVVYLHYSDAGTVYRGVFTAQDFRSFGLEPNMPPYGTMPFNGGFPKGEYNGTGIIIHGTDANGTPMVFHSYIRYD